MLVCRDPNLSLSHLYCIHNTPGYPKGSTGCVHSTKDAASVFGSWMWFVKPWMVVTLCSCDKFRCLHMVHIYCSFWTPGTCQWMEVMQTIRVERPLDTLHPQSMQALGFLEVTLAMLGLYGSGRTQNVFSIASGDLASWDVGIRL